MSLCMVSGMTKIEMEPHRHRHRIASVSYLNARPLIWGLEGDADVALELAVPSKLLNLLRDDRCDVALLPTIDFQRMDDLTLVPSGGIGCDGPTLTVRIFAHQ